MRYKGVVQKEGDEDISSCLNAPNNYYEKRNSEEVQSSLVIEIFINIVRDMVISSTIHTTIGDTK